MDEKLVSFGHKLWFYRKLYPGYKIIYSYVLSNWFKKSKYMGSYIEYMKIHNINVFWGEDSNYYENLFKWIDTVN